MAEFDVKKLEQRPDVKRQRRRGKKAVRRTEPPRAQPKGPITKGPRAYLHCSTCSRMMSTKEKKVRYGIPKQNARQHLEDHRMGRIKAPRAKP